MDAIAVLNAAETYECEELKRACVDYIFAERLRPLLEAPPDAIAPALHHELWRLATLRFDWTAAPRQPPAANDPGPTLKRPRTTT